MQRYLLLTLALLAAVALACGGGDGNNASQTPTGSEAPGTATLSPMEQALASVVLTSADLPEGLEGSAPDFATNEELAGPNLEELQRLIDVGRQLGVDVQFIPTDRLDESTPLRGLQSSASVYTREAGASQTFRETADQARGVDWVGGYPELEDGQVTQVDQKLGDESLWLRITGQLGCTFIVTPTPDELGVVPTQVCEDTKLFAVDEIIFRTGRVRAYLKVSSLFDPDAPRDSYLPEITDLAQLVVQRANAAFPG